MYCCIDGESSVDKHTEVLKRDVDTSVFSETVASPSAKSVWRMIHLVGDINILNMGDIEPRDYSNTILDGSDREVLKMK